MDTRTPHVRTGKAELVTAKDKDMPFPTCHIDVNGIRVASYLERDDAAELVRRYNAHDALVEALADMVATAEEVEGMMDGDKDKQEAWREELGRLYVALDAARATLKAAQQ